MTLLTTNGLIARMTPTALAETIAILEQYGNHDAAEREIMAVLRETLVANVGDEEAAELIAAAR